MVTQKRLFVFFLTLMGFFLHFYNLNWGAPFYFHPDERNIASAVTQIQFPEHMNPKFFAYGSLPIYSIFFTGLLAHILFSCQLLWDSCEKSVIPFHEAILASRFFSALFSTLLIPLLYILGRKLKDEKTGIIAAMLAATSVGFIQFAHFGTFEMWLTLGSLLLFWCCIEVAQKKSYPYLLWTALIFGILIATKVSSLVLMPLPLLAILYKHLPKRGEKHNQAWKIMSGLIHATNDLFIFTIIILSVYFVTNPYVRLDQKAFADSMHYEQGVAVGSIPVFYTGEFFDTIPVVFQLYHVFPFLLNPLIFILALPSFLYFVFLVKKSKHIPYLFLLLFFLTLLLSQAVLFVKWTRYMIPTLPFLYLILALALSSVIARSKTTKQSPTQSKSSWRLPRRSLELLAMTFLFVNLIFALSYFITAFVRSDTRVAAFTFAKETIPRDTKILSEVYDLGIVPFNSQYPNIKLFNFYDLDNNVPEFNEESLKRSLADSQYIILPSQRIIKSRLLQKKRFPKGYTFYTALFNGSLGFQKIYETPCDMFCQTIYLGSPSFMYEQTANVFDRPTVYIFKKVVQ